MSEWDYTPQKGEPGECYQAQVWDSDGDAVATVESYPDPEKANLRARLIAAAGNAALKAREMDYDPVRVMQNIPELLSLSEATDAESSVAEALVALKEAADYIEEETGNQLGAGRLHSVANEAADALGLEITVNRDS